MFESADAYASHLSTVIDDAELVTLAVRRKFPKYGYPQPAAIKPAVAPVPMAVSDGSALSRTKPTSKSDAWMSSEVYDRQTSTSMENGSRLLLTALWREHPKIMNTLAMIDAAVVVRP